MSKEYLEALERLVLPDVLHIKVCEKLGIGLAEDYDLIKQALLELKTIKKANPSEALYLAKAIEEYLGINLSIIKQALLKAQEQEKVLEIVIKKGVDVGYLKTCETLEEYNEDCWNDEEDFNKKLTQEEFDTLKRYSNVNS